MRFAVCLHSAAVARSWIRLHPTDLRAIGLGLALGAEVVAVEAVGERGSAPIAVGDALAAGAHEAVRIVDPALGAADADATGFALATALDILKVDLVLFGKDTDPDGLGDVPASIAHYMTALYVTDVVDISRSGNGDGELSAVDVTIRGGAWLRRIALPLNAVVGITGGRTPPPPKSPRDPGAPRRPAQVLKLSDLNIDPELVRRRDDRRGAIVSAPRPLVTLPSASSVANMLRRG